MRSLSALGGATGVRYAMWIGVVVCRSSPRRREVAVRGSTGRKRCAPMRAHATKHCQATSSVLRAASCSPIARLRHLHSLAAVFPHRRILHYLAFRSIPSHARRAPGMGCSCMRMRLVSFPASPARRFRVPGCVVALVNTRRIRPRYVAELSSTRITRWHTAPLLIVAMLPQGMPAMAEAAALPEEAHQQPPPSAATYGVMRPGNVRFSSVDIACLSIPPWSRIPQPSLACAFSENDTESRINHTPVPLLT
ncbi:hypothetical protein PSPO01_10447 [Paraphaeosphaeria sporulosa]